MKAHSYSMPVPEAVKKQGKLYPELSVLTSLGFALGVLAIAAYEFRKMDY